MQRASQQTFLVKRLFSSSMAAASEHQKMERIFQGYYSHDNQRNMFCIGRNYEAHTKELNNK